MKTECNTRQLEFQGVGRRGVVGKFDGGNITSDSGGLLLREVDERLASARFRVGPSYFVDIQGLSSQK